MSMLSTPNPATATPFYGELFGWETENFAFGEADITLWRLPGYEGGEPSQPVPADVVAAMIPAAAGEPAQWSVNFWVADAEATASSAADLGGAVVAEPFDTPVSRDAVLADPQGAVLLGQPDPRRAGRPERYAAAGSGSSARSWRSTQIVALPSAMRIQ
jgi:predicted enzyme related to lactoylglutathione lyase